MFLKDYCKENGLKMNWMAKKIGVSYTHLVACSTGKFKASKELADKIFNITNGQVTQKEISKFEYVKKEIQQ
jgi:DNA-binding transcriptional regulator YdaS (Cro superfamily)